MYFLFVVKLCHRVGRGTKVVTAGISEGRPGASPVEEKAEEPSGRWGQDCTRPARHVGFMFGLGAEPAPGCLHVVDSNRQGTALHLRAFWILAFRLGEV